MQNVAIFGVPRSGTSWLGQIFNSSPNVAYRYQPIFSYSFMGSLSEDSSSKDIEEFYGDLLSTEDDFVCQKKNISGNKTPEFKKAEITHLVWKEVRYLHIIENLIQKSSTKVIGIARHPCGVLKSWMKAPKEFNEEWDIRDEWQFAEKKNTGAQDFFGYERWLTAAKIFINLEKEYPDNFRVVLYESLLADTEEVIDSLFDFVDLRLGKQTKSFLKKSTSTTSSDPYGVYRNKGNSKEWKKELPKEIIKAIRRDDRFKKINKLYGWDT